MTAIACDEPRCTTKIPSKPPHVELSLPQEPTRHFCSLTCCWSWLKSHVEGKAQKSQASSSPVKTPVQTDRVKPRQAPTNVITKATKTYAPGEFKFDWVPDESAKGEIADILATSIDGPYSFVMHSWSPYVRVGPQDAQTPITIRSSERLHLMGAPSRTLRGLKGMMDFVIHFVGDHIELHAVLSVPGKQLWGQRALDG